MVRRTVALVGLVTLLGIAAPAAAQDLPEYTPDQRWARAEYLANGWFVLGVRYAKTMGQSVDQFAQAVFEVYDPSWTTQNMGPGEMLLAIYRNMMWQRGAQVEVLEASPALVRMRASRAYAGFFGDTGEAFGVTVAEYERVLDLFYQKICAKRGMTYEQRVEGDWMYITVTKS